MRNLLVAFALVATPALALDDPQTPLVDPMGSGQWSYHQVVLYGDPADIRFDDRVRVLAPASAEDSLHVPVLVDASTIPDVKSITLSADYGPIPKILTFYPGEAEAKLAFRFKIDQATPIRAVVETHSGSFHVGSVEIDAAGGGCTQPAAAYADSGWEDHLGEVRGRVWPASGRVRTIISHPMDTGLADGIPIFIIEDIALSSTEDGRQLTHVEFFEPVNEDPALTFYFPKDTLDDELRVSGRDNNGNEIDAVIRAYPATN